MKNYGHFVAGIGMAWQSMIFDVSPLRCRAAVSDEPKHFQQNAAPMRKN
jgi:hypothetical protein